MLNEFLPMNERITPGSTWLGDDRTQFCVWSPLAQQLAVHLLTPQDRLVALEPHANGYFTGVVSDVPPGSRYFYRINDEKERPDPASRFQPEGVHGPSEVVALPPPAVTDWRGVRLADYVLYELHVGTFSQAGTFTGIIPHLDDLQAVGVTAIELMPIGQFPGARNWGYDGAYLYAAQNSYGGPAGLLALVNACHERGIAVVMDVVYNHLGPEGNYLWDYGYYFTNRYQTPWGSAVNLDGPHSDEVRHFLLENIRYWIDTFQIDGFRLDATHALMDFSAHTFLDDLTDLIEERRETLRRHIYAIAETDRNDVRLLEPKARGGGGMDAQWSDDFHHAVRTLLSGNLDGYYVDYGGIAPLVRVLRDGYGYTGQLSPFRQRRHGTSARHIPAQRFVVCTQNHDQIGNRMFGDRLSTIVDFESLKLAAGIMLLSPFVPLLFMGEEYGETAPFPYFVSHADAQLVELVRQGRKEEFAAFAWQGEPPDPQAEATFLSAKLNQNLRAEGDHRLLSAFYTELLHLRKTLSPLNHLSKEQQEVVGYERQRVLYLRRWHDQESVFAVFNFGDRASSLLLPTPAGAWHKILDSAAWGTHPANEADLIVTTGETSLSLAPKTFVLYRLRV